MGIKNSYTDIKNSVSLGNRTLYELCNNHPLNSNPDDDEIDSLASKIWLIGRSYAASPERRNYTKSKKSLGNKLKTNNDGENFFFEELARNILSNDKFSDLVESVRNNATISFKVDNKKYDRQLLIESIQIVFLFNELLRESIKQIDYNITKNVGKNAHIKHFVSFSSKFMHFHLPNSIFIYDNFSYKHTKNHEKGVYKFSIASNPSLISISFNNSELKELKKYIYQELQGKNNFANKEREYIDHVSKSYLVLCKLYSHCQGRKQVTPRMVDNFLLAANHKQ